MGRVHCPSYRNLIGGPAHSRHLLDSSTCGAAQRRLARGGGGWAQALGLPVGLAVSCSHLHLISGEGRTQGCQEVTTHFGAGGVEKEGQNMYAQGRGEDTLPQSSLHSPPPLGIPDSHYALSKDPDLARKLRDGYSPQFPEQRKVLPLALGRSLSNTPCTL